MNILRSAVREPVTLYKIGDRVTHRNEAVSGKIVDIGHDPVVYWVRWDNERGNITPVGARLIKSETQTTRREYERY